METTRSHQFDVSLVLEGDKGLLAAAPRPAIAGGAPPAFGGSDDVWSPEHLLLASVNLCLMTTFRAIAAREPFARLDYRDRIEGTVTKTAVGLRFTSIRHHVELRVAAPDAERARQLIEKAGHHCLVANALNLPVELDVVVSTFE